MTARARDVLEDCAVALSMLEEEQDAQRWRIVWTAAVALVRAVGHVLKNVDGANPGIGKAADNAFRRWKSDLPEHEIFREFIEKERNTLLKEYESDVHPLETASLALEYTLKPLSGGDPAKLRDFVEIGENIYRPLVNGPWEGDDARDVLTAAIVWWERELDLIDQAVREKRL